VTQAQLLPIGQRVTHFDGGPDTHGKGTIVAYNGVKADEYAKTHLKDATAMVGATASPLKEQLFSAMVDSFYDGTRCPYVVQWDPRTDDSEIAKKYPQGYKDVYEPGSINAIDE
jgi:hypothetical protein